MTDTRDQFHELFGELYLPVTVTVGTIVVLVVLFAAVRYRRSRNRTPSRSSNPPTR
jgi:heme/copper-type cytochrome/quinol oxidase subunit 2